MTDIFLDSTIKLWLKKLTTVIHGSHDQGKDAFISAVLFSAQATTAVVGILDIVSETVLFCSNNSVPAVTCFSFRSLIHHCSDSENVLSITSLTCLGLVYFLGLRRKGKNSPLHFETPAFAAA